MRIAVVCEGVSDFLALREIMNGLASAQGKAVEAFEALQPRVDATSERQIGGGGWPRVKVWLEENCGSDLKNALSPPLFSSSKPYDVLIVHLDGDVVTLCPDFDA